MCKQKLKQHSGIAHSTTTHGNILWPNSFPSVALNEEDPLFCVRDDKGRMIRGITSGHIHWNQLVHLSNSLGNHHVEFRIVLTWYVADP